MIKNSNFGIPCTYCDTIAEPDTDPPVCKEHIGMEKKASAGPVSLKELETCKTEPAHD